MLNIDAKNAHFLVCKLSVFVNKTLVDFVKMILVRLQGPPSFLKLRATLCVPINAKGY